MNKVFDGKVKAWTRVGEPVVKSRAFKDKFVHKEQKWMLPNGDECDFDYLSGRTGVTIFALTDNGKIVLKEEFKQGGDRAGINLECASCILKPDEEILFGARRELLNETGFMAENMFVLPDDSLFGQRNYEYGYRIVFALGCEQKQDPHPGKTEVAFNVYTATAEEFWNAVNEVQVVAGQTMHAANAAASVGLINPNPMVLDIVSKLKFEMKA